MRTRTATSTLVWLGLAGVGTAAAIAVVRARRPDPHPAGAASWPPLVVGRPAPASAAGASFAAEPAPEVSPWVLPVAGRCPESHPVKGNASSRIYHRPGGFYYERTRPERCYCDEAAAQADGMRPAKR